MARVQVSDEVWTRFRVSLGPVPVSVALGKLVEREVGRQRRREAGHVEDARLALEDARSLTDELHSLITRLERVADRDEERGARAPPPGAGATEDAGTQSSFEDL